jgi:predicted GNAT superfamily acetyltransferase
MAMGLDLVEWTFDPLQALNAHLNFRRLGVVVREYEENIYGESSSPLHRGSPTDRLVAEWWVASPHVTARLEQPASLGALDGCDIVPVNVTRPHERWRSCVSCDLDRRERVVGIEIPTGFTDMLAHEPALAREWRFAAREMFTRYLTRGYTAVDFVLDRQAGLGRYLLADRDLVQEIRAGC